MTNKLYYGDCLEVLKEFPNEYVDLIYLDPPFNSKKDYNAFFKLNKNDETSPAQILAFEDTWQWGEQAQKEYSELLKNPNAGNLSEKLLPALRNFLAESDMMAYLVMMSTRLVELRRVLKNNGSLYLHCDQTASHYLKIILDSIFGAINFKNEIIWKRRAGTMQTMGKNKKFGSNTDIILYYTKSEDYVFNPAYSWNSLDYQVYIKEKFKYTDENGRKYMSDNLGSPSYSPTLIYEYKGYTPPKNGWAVNLEKMKQWDEEGRLEFPKNKNGRIRRKRYLDELKGKLVQTLWDDISPLNSQSQERLGYPTQKPTELLERIINTSSNPGDIILDPFCGCGTAIHAAQKLNRKWIGIDITHLAIALIKQRINHAFPKAKFDIEGTPKDVEAARYLAESNGNNGRYQFQYWALSLIDALPSQDKKKGPDSGIDGFIWAYDDYKENAKPFKIVISVKSGKIPANHIRELEGMIKNDVKMAFLITLEKPSKKMIADALSAGEYEYPNGKKFPVIQIFTIEDLLNGVKPNYIDYGEGQAMNKKPKREIIQKKQGDLN